MFFFRLKFSKENTLKIDFYVSYVIFYNGLLLFENMNFYNSNYEKSYMLCYIIKILISLLDFEINH